MATGKFAGTVAIEQQNRAFKTNSLPSRLAKAGAGHFQILSISPRASGPAMQQDHATHRAARLTT
jgi:hypothetical protein